MHIFTPTFLGKLLALSGAGPGDGDLDLETFTFSLCLWSPGVIKSDNSFPDLACNMARDM